ncbi:hypothetical protein KIN20_006091 [Parelaphostrongylus tenuis]|uniref:Uncharacterized protein n=1 Tax=Parelaphostrongylus tenuis TaxID=148309 RepID=A0AAD5MM33_PARTN|nr:hypothetical protein KIN20_006091 [Parelaphostrongylus tenuis]
METVEFPVPKSETCEEKQVDHIICYSIAPGELHFSIKGKDYSADLHQPMRPTSRNRKGD